MPVARESRAFSMTDSRSGPRAARSPDTTYTPERIDRPAARPRRSLTIAVCCARWRNSTITGSASSASGASWPKAPRSIWCAICCRSWTTSTAPSAAPGLRAVPEAYRRGVELIHRRSARDVLRARGVEPFDVVGEDFDPSWHEVDRQRAREPPSGRRNPRGVRRGYLARGGASLRAAQVKVAQA